MLLIANGRVITRDPNNPYIEDGAVIVDGESIVEVGTEQALKAAYPEAEYIDAHEGVIMPGLINAHTHIYSGMARGLAIKDNNPTNFYDVLDGTWWNIDRHLRMDGTRACAYATMLDSIKNGVTTLFDHHASFAEIPGTLFAIKDVAAEMGMRSCLCYEVSDRDGKEKRDQSIQENVDFAKWATENNSPMIKALFGGHALFTLSDETLAKMAEANNNLVGWHIHVSEGNIDVVDSRVNHHALAVERLDKFGMLGERTLLGHCIEVTQDEIDLIKNSNTRVVNNPQSNMGNAVGCAPVLHMMAEGIKVSLGTDAYTHDILESLKSFVCIQKHNAGMPNVAFGEGIQMLFENNADIATQTFGRTVGKLEKGAAADLIVMDYKPYTPFSAENVDGHILFGMMGRHCSTTIINGRIVYRDRQFVDLDEDKINAFIMEQAKKLWGDLNNRSY